MRSCSNATPSSAVVIHANNVRRVVRALELADEGQSYAKQPSGVLAEPRASTTV